MVVLLCAINASAADSPRLQSCLHRADDLPDMAAAESAAWIKQGGGNDAHLCHAFAQSNRGLHADSAQEFAFLAAIYDRDDAHRALLMHDLAAHEFGLAADTKNTADQYADALKINPDDTAALTGHAQILMQAEKYWDALADLTHALKTEPDNIEALRQRGLVWQKLGDAKNAQEDLTHAEIAGQGAKGQGAK